MLPPSVWCAQALASGAPLEHVTYHVHEKPLANATESCNATGKHFNPAQCVSAVQDATPLPPLLASSLD